MLVLLCNFKQAGEQPPSASPELQHMPDSNTLPTQHTWKLSRPVVETTPSSLPRLQAVVDDQGAMDDGVHTALDLPPTLACQESPAAASGIAFGSSPDAADHETARAGAQGCPSPPAVPLPPAVVAGAPNNNNPDQGHWIARDGVQFAYMTAVTVQINVKDLTSSWNTAPRVLYEVSMQAAILSLGIGVMTAVMAHSSSSSLYRRVSAFCARLGFILSTVLLVVYSCSNGRLGWIAGVLFGALAAGIMTVIWIRGEHAVAAAPPPA